MDGFYSDFKADMAAFQRVMLDFLRGQASPADVQKMAAACPRTYAHWGQSDRIDGLRRKDPETCASLIRNLREHGTPPEFVDQVRMLLPG